VVAVSFACILRFTAAPFTKREGEWVLSVYTFVATWIYVSPNASNFDPVGAPTFDLKKRELLLFEGAPRSINRSLPGVRHFDTWNFDAKNIGGQRA